MKKHSVILHGHPTSVSLEPEFWDHLKRVAAERQVSLQSLIEKVDEDQPTNLSSALRLLILADMEQQVEKLKHAN